MSATEHCIDVVDQLINQYNAMYNNYRSQFKGDNLSAAIAIKIKRSFKEMERGFIMSIDDEYILAILMEFQWLADRFESDINPEIMELFRTTMAIVK